MSHWQWRSHYTWKYRYCKGEAVFKWFSINYLQSNPGKSQFLLTSTEERSKTIENTNTAIKNSYSEKLLGVFINNEKKHLTTVSLTYAMTCLGRASNYMSKENSSSYRCIFHLTICIMPISLAFIKSNFKKQGH